jgi:molybdopterin converting factor small subunit
MKLGNKESILEVPEGTTVGTLLKRLEPQWRGNVLVVANGKVAHMNDLLNASDRVLILPLLAGG